MSKFEKTKYPGVTYLNTKNKGKTFYVAYRDYNNKSKRKKVDATSAKEANNLLSEILENKKKWDGHKVDTDKYQNSLTFDNLFRLYHLSHTDIKASLKDDYSRYKNYLRDDFGNYPVVSIKPIIVEGIRKDMLRAGKSNGLVRQVLALLRVIINFGINRDILPSNYTNPVSKVKFPSPAESRGCYLSVEEANLLLTHLKTSANKELYDLTLSLLSTGARFSEIAELKYSDIDFDGETLSLITKKRKDSGCRREVYLSPNLAAVIKKRKKYNEYVFSYIGKNGKVRLHNSMPRLWNMEVEKVFPGNMNLDAHNKLIVHSLRTTHVSWVASNQDGTADAFLIKDILGHTSIATSQRYVKIINKEKIEKVKRTLPKLS